MPCQDIQQSLIRLLGALLRDLAPIEVVDGDRDFWWPDLRGRETSRNHPQTKLAARDSSRQVSDFSMKPSVFPVQ
jgi:hypothetical protein